MQLINIGFGNMVSGERIISIVSPESAPLKRIIQEAKDEKKAIDATFVILSAVQPETIAGRLSHEQNELEKEKGEC